MFRADDQHLQFGMSDTFEQLQEKIRRRLKASWAGFAGYLARPPKSNVLESLKSDIMLWNRQSIRSQSPVLAEYPHPLSGLSVSGPSPKGVVDSEWLVVERMYYSAKTTNDIRLGEFSKRFQHQEE